VQGQGHLATVKRILPGRCEAIDWIRNSCLAQVNFLVREDGWAPLMAEAYTLLTCCAQSALTRATGDEDDLRQKLQESNPLDGDADTRVQYSTSRELVTRLLMELARLQIAPAPLTYAHLHGKFSLTESDSIWGSLPTSAPGRIFASSAIIMASGEVESFPNSRGLHALVCRSGVRHPHLMESDVVCFKSSLHHGNKSHSMVSVGGDGYHLPPGASIQLVSIADQFRVTTRQGPQVIKRRLYTVYVRFDTVLHGISA